MTNGRVDLGNVLRLDTKDAKLVYGVLTGRVPAEYVRKRDARGGIKLSYVSHETVNTLMLQAFGPYWSWDVQETGVNEKDGVVETGWARGTLTLYVEMIDGGILPVTTTAMGMFDNTRKMLDSSVRAAAASRALCKAVARRLGFGLEFYGDVADVTMTAKRAWGLLKEEAAAKGVDEADLAAQLKDAGFSYEALVDQKIFDQARAMIGANEPEPEPEPEPGSGPWKAPTQEPESTEPDPDLVFEEAKKLGAVETVHWPTFFGDSKRLYDLGATATKNILDDIFGTVVLAEVPVQLLRDGLAAWQGSKTNDERKSIRATYRAEL